MLSPSVNTYIQHVNVLQLLGRQVKPLLPTTCECPLCSGRLQVYAEALGGVWYNCTTCEFAGDSVQLYQSAKGLQTAEQAVEALRRSIPSIGQAEQTAVLRYFHDELSSRSTCVEFWNASRQRALDLDLASQTLLHQYGLYMGYPWRIAPPFGVAGKRDVEDLPGNPKVKGSVIVLPIMDLPGKIIGFYFIGNGHTHTYLVDGKLRDEQNAFIFGDQLRVDNSQITCINDPVLALNLHVRYQQYTGRDDLPVVAWLPGTHVTWYAFNVDRLLIGCQMTDYEVCAQAASCRATTLKFIEVLPRLDNPMKVSAWVDDHGGCTRILDYWQDRAYTPVRPAYVDNPLTAVNNVEGEDPGMDFNSERLIDRPTGWYVKNKSISNVKLIPRQVVRYVNSNSVICKGELQFNGQLIPFETSADNLMDVKLGWYKDVLVKATGVAPVINTRWYKHLFAIGSQMYRPTITAINSGLAWDGPAKAWMLPKFSITKETITPVDLPVAVDCPGAKLTGVDDSQIKVLLDSMVDDEATAGAWGLLTAVVYNAVAIRNGKQPVNIGLLAPELDAHYLTRWIANGIGLDEYKIKGMPIDPVTILDAHRTSGLPCLISTVDEHRVDATRKLIGCRVPANVISLALPGSNMLKELYPNWMFIPNADGQADVRLLSLIPVWLQLFTDDDPNTDYPKVLNTLAGWAEVVGGVKAKAVHTRALGILGLTRSPIKSAAKAVLALYCRLVVDMKFKYVSGVEQVFRVKATKAVANAVSINVKSLVTTLHRLGYPTPIWQAIVQAFIDDGALIRSEPRNLIIHREWWDNFIKEISDVLRGEGSQETEIAQLLLPVLSVSPISRPVQDNVDVHASKPVTHS